MLCPVKPKNVLTMHNVSNIWHVPLIMSQQDAHNTILEHFRVEARTPLDLSNFRGLATKWDTLSEIVSIAMVGKYTVLADAYLSVVKALQHASMATNRKLEIRWIEASDLEETTKASDPDAHHKAWEQLQTAHGILVPGGFGNRGIEGKILAAR